MLARVIRLGALALAVAAVTACAPPSSNWWMHQGNGAHTGYNRGLNDRVKRVLRWDVALAPGSARLTAPWFGRNAIFIGVDSILYALSPQTGATLWTFAPPPPQMFDAEGAAVADYVIAATWGTNGHVYALQQGGGAIVWQYALGTPGSSAAIAVDGSLVFVIDHTHQLRALNAGTGAVQWSVSAAPGTSNQYSSPAVGYGLVFVGTENSLLAFNQGTGAQVWSYTLPGAVGGSSPVLYDGGSAASSLVLIGSSPGPLQAVNAATGAPVWTYPVTNSASLIAHTVATALGRVFLIDYQTIKALDVTTGAPVWSQLTTTSVLRHSPVLGSQVVYYADEQEAYGRVMATGAPFWQAPIPGNGATAAVGRGSGIEFELLVVANKGHVYAYR